MPTIIPTGGLASLAKTKVKAAPAVVASKAPAADLDPSYIATRDYYADGPVTAGSGMLASYELPDSAEATQGMRDLQTQSTRGLSDLMGEDTTAARDKIQKALYDTQAEGINTAADRARETMLEGTFGHGVGASSMTVELAGRGQQEHSDALARAEREAYTGAGVEQRADLASRSGLYNDAFDSATTGLQGDANVALVNLARQQQESQFGRNLAFEGNENAANRAQDASQFGENLGLSYAQLAQKGDLFDKDLTFQGSQKALDRSLTSSESGLNRSLTTDQAALNRTQDLTMLAKGQDFTGSQNALNRAQDLTVLDDQQTFTGGQNDLNRALALLEQKNTQDWTGGENLAARDFTASQTDAAQDWQADQNTQSQDVAKFLASSGQTFAGDQNTAATDATMQRLLLQLANQRDIASNNANASALTTAGTGLGSILGPALAALAKGWA